jgi:dienelactone hydrolase
MPAMAWLQLLAALMQPPALELPRGAILRDVASLQDPGQSYALYLPSGYRAERSWPIIYCFDPGGRGDIPVALFKDGAERLGFILAGSHNARNGPWKAVLLAARALWGDTHSRLSIDGNRVFAAGFSGGARAAFALGKLLSIRVAGVIGCGGGLPEWLSPSDVAAVPWFGTVGLRDFNYAEMHDLEREMQRQGTPCLLRVFQGGHSWPPAKLAMEAIAWLAARAAVRFRPGEEDGVAGAPVKGAQ